jgi:hypothetical protein
VTIDPASWDHAVRRIANGEPLEDVLEQRAWAARDRFRQELIGMGDRGISVLAEYDARMRENDLGISSARAAWHALSVTQKWALRECAAGRQPVARIATLRNLERRDLVSWDGGAFSPESKVVITERGRFVLAQTERADG